MKILRHLHRDGRQSVLLKLKTKAVVLLSLIVVLNLLDLQKLTICCISTILLVFLVPHIPRNLAANNL